MTYYDHFISVSQYLAVYETLDNDCGKGGKEGGRKRGKLEGGSEALVWSRRDMITEVFSSSKI